MTASNGMTNLPRIMAVVGGGTMGAGIAQTFISAGSQVILVESNDQEASRRRIRDGLGRLADKGKLSESTDAIMAQLTLATDITVLDRQPDIELVVEAVPEDLKLKLEVLGAISGAVSTAAIIASNTSSLSIAEMAVAINRPERFLGTHFFNPVPVSSLLELVIAPQTSVACQNQARAWGEALGKTCVTVRDSPGFATSRLGVMLGLEAMRMVEEKIASAADIDTAMELGYRHPMGPLRTTDLVGLDVRLAIAEHLAATLGPRFAPPQILRDKVAAGELGRKCGHGFFHWDTAKKRSGS